MGTGLIRVVLEMWRRCRVGLSVSTFRSALRRLKISVFPVWNCPKDGAEASSALVVYERRCACFRAGCVDVQFILHGHGERCSSRTVVCVQVPCALQQRFQQVDAVTGRGIGVTVTHRCSGWCIARCDETLKAWNVLCFQSRHEILGGELLCGEQLCGCLVGGTEQIQGNQMAAPVCGLKPDLFRLS